MRYMQLYVRQSSAVLAQHFVSIKDGKILFLNFLDGVPFSSYCKKVFLFCGHLIKCLMHCVGIVALNTQMELQYLTLFFREQIRQT